MTRGMFEECGPSTRAINNNPASCLPSIHVYYDRWKDMVKMIAGRIDDARIMGGTTVSAVSCQHASEGGFSWKEWSGTHSFHYFKEWGNR